MAKDWMAYPTLDRRDPTLVVWKACYNNMYGGLERRNKMARLHVYPDDNVPEDIMSNVSHQISQVRLTTITDSNDSLI